jgi:hypothetical protein
MRYGRNTDGSFTSGNAGKPRGSRNKATVAIESLLEGQAEALTQKAIFISPDRRCSRSQALYGQNSAFSKR